MNKAFEVFMRRIYRDRDDLSSDPDGHYSRQVVKRMFEMWYHCKGGA